MCLHLFWDIDETSYKAVSLYRNGIGDPVSNNGRAVCVFIIILSCHQHGYPWLLLDNPPYRSSFPVGPQGYTPYPHRAAVCRFELAALLSQFTLNTLRKAWIHMFPASSICNRLIDFVFVFGKVYILDALYNNVIIFLFCLVWFLCLMAYQPL